MIIYFTLGVIFMVVAVIITFISSFYETESVVERISVKIANIIQILFLVGLLISYQTYVDTSKQLVLTQQSTLAEKGWVDVYRKIQENYERCPNFCNSLGYKWQIPTNIHVRNGIQTSDDYGSVLSLSILIFQSIDSVISYFLYYDTTESMKEWLNSFIIWCNYDTLYTIWNNNKFIYGKETQIFGDKIFTTIRDSKTRPTNPNDIIKLSKEICKSVEIKELFKGVQKIPPCQ